MENYTIKDAVQFIKSFLQDCVNETEGDHNYYKNLKNSFDDIIYEISQADYTDSPAGEEEIAEQIVTA